LSKFFGWILELFCHHRSKLNISPYQERNLHDLLMDRTPLFLASNKGLGPAATWPISIYHGSPHSLDRYCGIPSFIISGGYHTC
jgi:hypothetical protein